MIRPYFCFFILFDYAENELNYIDNTFNAAVETYTIDQTVNKMFYACNVTPICMRPNGKLFL